MSVNTFLRRVYTYIKITHSNIKVDKLRYYTSVWVVSFMSKKNKFLMVHIELKTNNRKKLNQNKSKKISLATREHNRITCLCYIRLNWMKPLPPSLSTLST